MTDHVSKNWLITGADKGLGASVAEAALRQGDNVAVTVLAKDGSHPLAAEFPDTFMAIHLDAKDHGRFAEVVGKVVAKFGGIDVLHNNAGYGLIGLAEETDESLYRPLFEVNFFAVVEMIRHVLPVMRRQRSGHILNVSSIAGFGAAPGWSFYSATKFAVEGYSEAFGRGSAASRHQSDYYRARWISQRFRWPFACKQICRPLCGLRTVC